MSAGENAMAMYKGKPIAVLIKERASADRKMGGEQRESSPYIMIWQSIQDKCDLHELDSEEEHYGEEEDEDDDGALAESDDDDAEPEKKEDDLSDDENKKKKSRGK